MGATGSYTAKASISPLLFPFTKWNTKDVTLFLQRGLQDLPETFGLRKHEFEYLVGGTDQLTILEMRSLFQEIFDTDQNGMIDKYEVMCIIIMTSKISSIEKVNFFFNLFNFNEKGYLNHSELTLLLMAVTRGAFKIDQKFAPPQVKTIHSLVREAFKHATTKQDELRKPELVTFVTKNVEVTSFLECWRGHAAQVLLPPGLKWRDLSFPCNEVSITPSSAWLRYALPTKEFIIWRRRDRVGTELNSLAFLFIHTETFMKTVDRKDVYCGEGVLGTGCLKQGLLADRHFLNALATLTSRPKMLQSVFASTGQEEVGRFCVRLYECASWRTVYVDDRIPCAPNLYPAFSSSSSPLEAWVVLLEKAVAKYMGSYGAVAASANRVDATLTMLRYFTGGHVFSLYTYDLIWNSVMDEVEDKDMNGLLKVLQYKEQGLVAFGRSASLGFMNNQSAYSHVKQAQVSSSSTEPSLQVLPPLGHLFPVVGRVVVKGYIYLVLRDSFGYLQDSEMEVNRDTGFCNTFKVKVEDIPKLYDTMVVSQFPDIVREEAESHRMESWNTAILSQTTENVHKPAVFHIKIEKNHKRDKKKGNATEAEEKKKQRGGRRKSTVAEIDQMLHRSDSLVIKSAEEEELDLAPHLRLKDRTDFSRINDKKNAFLQAGVTTEGEMQKREEEKEVANKQVAQQRISLDENLVEISLTISSNCEWSIAGGTSVGAQLRAKLIPSSATLEETITSQQQKLFTQKLRQLRYQQAKLEQARLLEAQHDVPDLNEEKSTMGSVSFTKKIPSSSNVTSKRNSILNLNSASRSDRNSILLMKDKDKESARDDASETTEPQSSRPTRKNSVLIPIPYIDEEQLYADMRQESVKRVEKMLSVDFVFTFNRCWASRTLSLVPGTYLLLADVSFSGRKMNLYRHLSIEFDENRLDLDEAKAAPPSSALSYEDVKLMCLPTDVSEAPWLEPGIVQRANIRKHTFQGVTGEDDKDKEGSRGQSRGRNILGKGDPAHNNSAVSAKSVESWTSLQELEKQVFPRQKRDVVFQNEALQPLDHIIWCEVSSYDYVKLSPATQTEKQQESTKIYEHVDYIDNNVAKKVLGVEVKEGKREERNSIISILESIREDPGLIPEGRKETIREEDEESVASAQTPAAPKLLLEVEHSLANLSIPTLTWPFCTETQAEAATAYLHDQLAVQREEVERLGTEFINIASKVNELKKNEIIRTRRTIMQGKK